MVNDIPISEVDLPARGDQVDVAWGLTTVRGRVLEAYMGSRPRVVVEIFAGQISDDPSTVTVPVGAVEPTSTADSPWAAIARFERTVAEAINRTMPVKVSRIELNSQLDDQEIDILAFTDSGRQLIVEVKGGRQPIDRNVLHILVNRLTGLAKKTNGVCLIVLRNPPKDASFVDTLRSRIVEITRWSGPDDDDQLATTLKRLMLQPGPTIAQ